MVGLLPVSMARAGLLGTRPRADEFDEQMFMSNPYGRQKMASDQVMATGMKPALMPAPAPSQQMQQQSLLPQRGRVNPLRVLDNFLFTDASIGGSIDAERQRLEREAMRPQEMARAERLRQQAAQMGPAAELAFETNPEKFGESIGYQLRPQVVQSGAIQSVPATGQIVGAPQRFEFGDTVQSFNPVTGQIEQLAQRGPTIAEQTAQDRLAWDQDYGRNKLDIDRGNLANQTLTANRPQVVTTGQGAVTTLITPQGEVATQIQGNAPPNPAMQNAREAVEGFRAANDRISGILRMVSGDSEAGIKPAFDLSPAKAVLYDMELTTGRTSPEAAAYGAYLSEIMSLVSDALRLNTGPQTDKDYERELQALARNINNPEYIRARLPLIIEHNNRLAAARLRAAGQDGAADIPSLPPGFQLD